MQFRLKRGGSLIDGGSAPFEIGSGERRSTLVAPTDELRAALAGRPKVKLRVTAATRSEDGGIRLTSARRFIAG